MSEISEKLDMLDFLSHYNELLRAKLQQQKRRQYLKTYHSSQKGKLALAKAAKKYRNKQKQNKQKTNTTVYTESKNTKQEKEENKKEKENNLQKQYIFTFKQ